jgi:hypothetical protein
VGLENARDLVDVPAGNAERLVVMTYGVGIGSFKEAVHLPFRIMEELDLTDPEFVGFVILRFSRYLLDRILREYEIIVKVHELWHWVPLPVWPKILNVLSIHVQKREPTSHRARPLRECESIDDDVEVVTE